MKIDIHKLKSEFITIVKETDKRSFAGNKIWELQCICGKQLFWTKRQILHHKSCGCKASEIKKRIRHENHGRVTGEYFSDIRKNAIDRGIEFNISIKDTWNLFLKQKGKCALTGTGLHFGNSRIKKTASLDRIDSSKGYSINNIQWVHKIVNFMKQQFTQTEFIKWCGKVYNFKKE